MKIRVVVFSLFVGFVFMVLSSCATAYKQAVIPGELLNGPVGIDSLKRADYKVIGPALGMGEAEYIGLWPLPIFWVKAESYSSDLPSDKSKPFSVSSIIFGFMDTAKIAKSIAAYNAVESVPDADALISVRTHEEGNGVGIWYKHSKVIVKGKAISINVDQKQ